MAKRRKAPPGCFWRGGTLYGRVKINGRDKQWTLNTSDPKVALQRRNAGKARIVADAKYGDAPRTFVEVVEGWENWIVREVRPKAAQRYGCSLGQIAPWVENRQLSEIDGRLVAEIVRERAAAGVSNATIKRDLVALSSVLNYAMDQGWIDENPVLAKMRRVKERRDPIVLPRPEDIALVTSRAPGMVKDLVAVAIVTGAREEELLKATRADVDHERRQMTLIGKRGKRRSISMEPFDGYEAVRALPTNMRTPLLFWHSGGESFKNFSSQFSAVIKRTAAWAKANGIEFHPFRFHDLRHLHAIKYLKEGCGTIYALQHRLGHKSVKTTEGYLEAGYLTHEEIERAKGAEVEQKVVQAAHGGARRA